MSAEIARIGVVDWAEPTTHIAHFRFNWVLENLMDGFALVFHLSPSDFRLPTSAFPLPPYLLIRSNSTSNLETAGRFSAWKSTHGARISRQTGSTDKVFSTLVFPVNMYPTTLAQA